MSTPNLERILKSENLQWYDYSANTALNFARFHYEKHPLTEKNNLHPFKKGVLCVVSSDRSRYHGQAVITTTDAVGEGFIFNIKAKTSEGNEDDFYIHELTKFNSDYKKLKSLMFKMKIYGRDFDDSLAYFIFRIFQKADPHYLKSALNAFPEHAEIFKLWYNYPSTSHDNLWEFLEKNLE